MSVRLLLILAAMGTTSGEIAFMRDGDVHLIDLETGRERLLCELEYNRPLVWSPDGRHLIVWKHSEIGWDLWRIDARDDNGAPSINFTNTEHGGCRSASFSPDGTQIAFMRDGPMGVWMMNADGSDLRRLTKDRVNRDGPPQWSPDGRQLLYNTLESPYIHLLELDSQESRPLMRGTAPRWITEDRIMFATQRDGRFTLIVSDLDGSNERRVSDPGHDAWSAAMSPHRDRVAYLAPGEEGVMSLVVASIEDSVEPRTLLTKAGLSGMPAWSPDSSSLAITSLDADEPGLWIIQIESAEARRIGNAPHHWPAWRPLQSESE